MTTFQENMAEYRIQLEKGTIQKAYQGLMQYMLDLKTDFKNKFPDYAVPGSLYFGYMDMTYFPLFPPALKDRNLKVAIVFIHETCRFEAWLSGANKGVQAKYWKLFKDTGWEKYRLVETLQGADSIVECTLAEDPDFGDMAALTDQIERKTETFIKDVESFLAAHVN